MNCSNIFDFSYNLWENELNSPTDISWSAISGWTTSTHTLGKLSNLTYQCFSGVSGCVEPPLSTDEFGILGEMYKVTYYNGLVKKNLGAGSVRKITELTEGDSKIRWQNDNETAKIYASMAKDAQAQLNYLIRSYNNGRNIPKSVDFYKII